MVVTMKQVMDLLNAEEPRYSKGSELGPEALSHVEAIIKAAEPMLAAKATYLAGFIQDERSVAILIAAANSKHLRIRLAAAGACQHLHFGRVNEILDLLKNDQHKGVRAAALRSIELRSTEKEKKY